jgi:hypothetical protein
MCQALRKASLKLASGRHQVSTDPIRQAGSHLTPSNSLSYTAMSPLREAQRRLVVTKRRF